MRYVATTPNGISVELDLMTAFLESVRVTVQGEIRQDASVLSVPESNYLPASLVGPSGVNSEAEVPLPPATATAGQLGTRTGE